ncbi:MAG: KpsF/GutQ family sugar-phosphate isomerase [Calditerrivibrio sp.]|nr:KpsF/GutQ family sugar-phosphate isomerase [Calditerrivibrio sp.]
MNLLNIAKETMKIEADAILRAMDRLDENFEKAVHIILKCEGRVIVTGMGKSGLIGKKIAATLSSTGTPSIFLHPAEGVHGDLGVITSKDCIIAISNSGETDELISILPVIKMLGVKIIALVGRTDSTLAKKSDCVIDASVLREACPLNLAPTASTTVALALGDALAVVLLNKRGFKKEDFAMFHPSGALGKRLLIKVEDLYHTGDELPVVKADSKVSDSIFEMTSKGFGCTTVVDDSGKLIGILTDGDLRRGMQKFRDLFDRKVIDVCTLNPKTIDKDELAATALQIMESKSITSLITVDKDGKPEGIIHIHDILKKGIV